MRRIGDAQVHPMPSDRFEEYRLFLRPPMLRAAHAIIAFKPMGDSDAAVQLAPSILDIEAAISAPQHFRFGQRVLSHPILQQPDIRQRIRFLAG
ncbi:hypothetical protein D3C81_1256440 [compost metagenome]